MKYAIVGGGPSFLIPSLEELKEKGYEFIGVDKGCSYLAESNIEAVAVFGDFDSLPKRMLSQIEKNKTVFRFSPKKNESDTELALLWCCEQQPTEILLLGMTGGRLDHEWCNIGLMRRIQKKFSIDIHIVDINNDITLFSSGEYEIPYKEPYKYISFLPFSEEVVGLELHDFAYPLKKTNISWGTTLTVSNEFLGETGSFSFQSGIIMVVRSRDHEK